MSLFMQRKRQKNQEPRTENKLEQRGMRLLVSMLHRVIKYQLNSHTGMSYCSLMFTSVLSDIRLLLSFFRLLLDNPKTMLKKHTTKTKNLHLFLG